MGSLPSMEGGDMTRDNRNCNFQSHLAESVERENHPDWEEIEICAIGSEAKQSIESNGAVGFLLVAR
jgi:hypothetical protein